MDYRIRPARQDDREGIYALKSASIRPYVEKIWGWDEEYQRNDFEADFLKISHFLLIEANGEFAGFVHFYFSNPYYEIAEFHLIPEYRGKGIGSSVLRSFQEECVSLNRKLRIGCFKENHRAKHLYRKLGFTQTGETDTHCILQYP